MQTRLTLFFIASPCLAAAVFAAQQPTSDPAGSAAIGESLFFGKAGCSGCHEVNGKGGVTGPDLSAAGSRSPEALRAKILNPGSGGGAGGGGGPTVVVVKTQDGRQIEGVRRS